MAMLTPYYASGYIAVAFSTGPYMYGGGAAGNYSETFVLGYSPVSGTVCYLGCVLDMYMK